MLRQILRPIMVAASLVIFFAYATIMLRGPQGLTALSEKRTLVRTLEEQNADLRHEIEEKTKRIQKLNADPETAIRQRLEMQRPHETVFKSATPTPAAP